MNVKNKENINVNLSNVIVAMDLNNDGFVSLKEFMSANKSLGPQEVPRGLFKHYAQPTLSYHFINLLIKTNHPIISKIVCLPNLNYCVYTKPGNNFKNIETIITTQDVCPVMDNVSRIYMYPVKANLLLFNPPEYTKDYKKTHGTNAFTFVIPDSLKDNLYVCNHQNKHIVFLNLILLTTKNNRVIYQHANIIIINLLQKTIERFDPHGGSTILDSSSNKRIKNIKRVYKQELIDEILRDKFKSVLPDYKYIDLSETCPYLGPQAKIDKFGGLCVTWSLMYFLLRVLNPKIKQSEINKKMIIGKRDDILDYVLRFQRYVIDYLRNLDFL